MMPNENLNSFLRVRMEIRRFNIYKHILNSLVPLHSLVQQVPAYLAQITCWGHYFLRVLETGTLLLRGLWDTEMSSHRKDGMSILVLLRRPNSRLPARGQTNTRELPELNPWTALIHWVMTYCFSKGHAQLSPVTESRHHLISDGGM